jgi:type I restriction enzyme S subunit
LRLKKGVDIDFIESFLNSYAFWSQVIEMKSGSAMPNVNAEKLKTLKLPKCENETQKIVGSFFKNDDYQKNHSNLYKKVKDIEVVYDKCNNISSEIVYQLSIIKKLRQQLLQDAVQGKLVEQNADDEPASELLKKIKAEKEQLIKEKKLKKEKELPVIKEEEIPFEIPKGWVWCRLGEIIELISGQHIDTSDYNELGLGLPYLTGPSDFGSVNPVPTRWTAKPKVISEDGDILITVKGSGVGKTNINHLDKVVISRQLMAIRVNRIDREFIHYFIKNSFDLLQAEKKGTGIPGIGRENILERLIPIPPLLEQHRIVQKLEQLMLTCDELEESIKLSTLLNEKLLQQVLREALSEQTHQ